MTEYIEHHPLGGRHVVIFWWERWYKIPFVALEAICDSWRISRHHKNRYGVVITHGDPAALRAWLNETDEYYRRTVAIADIKRIIDCEMPDMMAYLCY